MPRAIRAKIDTKNYALLKGTALYPTSKETQVRINCLSKTTSKSLLMMVAMAASSAFGGSQEVCYTMHNRLTGVPPSAASLASCVALVDQGKLEEAALTMTDHNFFYSDTIRYLVSPWTNENQTVLVDFNDMIATATGIVRDNLDWRTFLSGDFVYTCENDANLPPYANENNDHYAACGQSVNIKDNLVQKQQAVMNPILAGQPESVPAGMFTTRAFAQAFYIAGTNRAATRWTLDNFLCEDIDAFHDTSVADFHIRQDVDRSPGGSTKTFINECKGCHSGMDPLNGAYAYLDWDDDNGVMQYTKPAGTPTPEQLAAAVVPKYFNNANTFPNGFRTVSDEWINLWTTGQNARVGWGVPEGTIIRGSGPKSMGEMIANTDQFARCTAKHVYSTVCLSDRKVTSPIVIKLSDKFKASGYNMRQLFATTAAECLAEDPATAQ